MNADVVIVVPPVFTVVRPLIGPSLLKAQLLERGISCNVVYANIEYAEAIGVEENEWLSSYASTNWLLSEWIFSHDMFPSHHNGDPNDYFETVIDGECPVSFRRRVLELCNYTSAFVESQVKAILAHSPRIVGFSTSFEQTVSSLAIARAVKRRAPETVIVFGGSNCMGTMGQGLLEAFKDIDVVFNGEADEAFPAFCERVVADGLPHIERRVITSRLIDAMDKLPVPDYADFFETVERMSFADDVEMALAIETSRGCWWGAKHHCTFCGLNTTSMAFRSKSSERAVEEIRYLSRKWGVRNFAATDNIMNFDHIRTVFKPLAEEKAGYRFFYEVKANLRYDQLETLAAAGVDTIQPGIEALSDETLKLIKKGVSALQNIYLLRRCKELNIHPIWNILGGFPGETEESYLQTAALLPKIEHLHPPRNVAQLRLDRFSPNFEKADAMGFFCVAPLPAYRYVYPLDKKQLSAIAYFYGGDRKDFVSDGLTEKLRQDAARWQRAHFNSTRVPILAGLRIASMTLIKDTRSSASAEHATLNQLETDVLAAFDTIRPIKSTLDTLAGAHGIDRGPLVEAFGVLEEKAYIVSIGTAAASLVCFPKQNAVRQPATRLFPGGELKRSIGHAFAREGRVEAGNVA